MIERLGNAIIDFFTDELWLIPLFVSFMVAVLLPGCSKGAWPLHWRESVRDTAIRASSIIPGLACFVSMRLAMLALAGKPLNTPEMIITGWVGVAFILAIPLMYDCFLPAKFKRRINYQATVERRENRRGMKTVRLSDGRYIAVPKDFKTDYAAGEETVVIGDTTVRGIVDGVDEDKTEPLNRGGA